MCSQANEIRIGNLAAQPGEKCSGMYQVAGIDFEMPVTIVNGAQPGKRVLITAGIHACEYVGIQAAIELARELNPEEISGAVVLVHPVNTSGFWARVPAVVPEAGENLNRLFPGDMESGFAGRIAYALTCDFQDPSDFYLDLHGGDMSEELIPFVFYPGVAEPEVVAESRRVAGFLNLKYALKSGATTGAYNSAAKRGTPSLLIERGGRGLWGLNEVESYKNDVRAALFALGVYPHNPNEGAAFSPADVRNPVYLAAGREGCWYPGVRAGDFVTKGAVLGELRDFFGRVLETYSAEINGVVLYRATSLAVRKDTELVAYAEAGK